MRILWAVLRLGLLALALVAVAGIAAFLTIQWVTTTRSVEVPDLVGMHPKEATRALNALGLRIEFEEDARNQFSDRIPEGHILDQSPAPGADLKQDRKVRVVLSLGQHALYVPRVVGEPLTGAQVRLQQAGLGVGDIVYVPSPIVAENVVIDEEPMRLRPDQDRRVNLLVSSGAAPPEFVMPDMIGKPGLRVRAFLELNGFRVRVEAEPYDGVPDGTVIRQKPLGGHRVAAGDAIGLWVSRPSPGYRSR